VDVIVDFNFTVVEVRTGRDFFAGSGDPVIAPKPSPKCTDFVLVQTSYNALNQRESPAFHVALKPRPPIREWREVPNLNLGSPLDELFGSQPKSPTTLVRHRRSSSAAFHEIFGAEFAIVLHNIA
jgi:hypothetical protein